MHVDHHRRPVNNDQRTNAYDDRTDNVSTIDHIIIDHIIIDINDDGWSHHRASPAGRARHRR